jgi:predicted DsbA family dithiol-disulfide isomerase
MFVVSCFLLTRFLSISSFFFVRSIGFSGAQPPEVIADAIDELLQRAENKRPAARS